MSKLIILLGTLIAAMCLAFPSYAIEGQKYEDYVREMIRSTAKGGNKEENIFDGQLLNYWNRMIKKSKCFTVQGIDAELTMHQDSDAHGIRIYKPEMTRVGIKVRAAYTVFGDKIDKDFYLVEQDGSIKLRDVCDHPSEIGDQCYRHIIEKGMCAD